MIICPTCMNAINYCDCIYNRTEDDGDLYRTFINPNDDIPENIVKNECEKIWHPTEPNPVYEIFPQKSNFAQYELVNDFTKTLLYSYHNSDDFLSGDPNLFDNIIQPWPFVRYANAFGTIYYSSEVAMGFPDGTVRFTVLYSKQPLFIEDVGDAIKRGKHKFEWFSWEERNEAEQTGFMNQGLRGNRLVQGNKSKILRPPPEGYIIDYGDNISDDFDGSVDSDYLPLRESIPDSFTVGDYTIKPNISRYHSIFTYNWQDPFDVVNIQKDPYILFDVDTNEDPIDGLFLGDNLSYLHVRINSTTRDCIFAVQSCNPFTNNFATVNVIFTPINLLPENQIEVEGEVRSNTESFTITLQHTRFGFECLFFQMRNVNPTTNSFKYLLRVEGYWDETLYPVLRLPLFYPLRSETPFESLTFEPNGTYSPSRLANAELEAACDSIENKLIPQTGFYLRGECVYGTYGIAGVPFGGAGISPVLFEIFNQDISLVTNLFSRLPGAQSNIYGIIENSK